MAIAFSPTCKPFPPVPALTAPSNVFPSSSLCYSAFSNRAKLWLPNRIKSPSSFGTLIRCSAGSGGAVLEIDQTRFSDVVLKSERPVLVEFVANWCGPCRLMAPAIQSLAQEYQDKLSVVKVDHDSNPRLIEEYKVYGLPMLVIFQNGKEVPESRREGAISKDKLKKYVDEFLESVSIV